MSFDVASREDESAAHVPSLGPRVEVSAFQIDALALATIKQGDKLLASGLFECRRLHGGNITLVLDKSTDDCLAVFVEHINYDPKVVGEPARPGQFRMSWRGYGFLDPDPEDGAGAAQPNTPEATAK